jgi:hypothetical protein
VRSKEQPQQKDGGQVWYDRDHIPGQNSRGQWFVIKRRSKPCGSRIQPWLTQWPILESSNDNKPLGGAGKCAVAKVMPDLKPRATVDQAVFLIKNN